MRLIPNSHAKFLDGDQEGGPFNIKVSDQSFDIYLGKARPLDLLPKHIDAAMVTKLVGGQTTEKDISRVPNDLKIKRFAINPEQAGTTDTIQVHTGSYNNPLTFEFRENESILIVLSQGEVSNGRYVFILEGIISLCV